MNELFTVIACFLKKKVAQRMNNKQQSQYETNLAKLKQYQPPVNTQVAELKAKKIEIQSTIQQFNSPSTFAKYSKMQRELIKFDKAIEASIKKAEEVDAVNRT